MGLGLGLGLELGSGLGLGVGVGLGVGLRLRLGLGLGFKLGLGFALPFSWGCKLRNETLRCRFQDTQGSVCRSLFRNPPARAASRFGRISGRIIFGRIIFGRIFGRITHLQHAS